MHIFNPRSYTAFCLLLNFVSFWLCWVPVALQAFSSCGERGLLSSCGVRGSHCSSFSCCRAQALGRAAGAGARGLSSCSSPGSRAAAAVAGDGLSCSGPRGLFPGQGAHPLLRHWQVDALLSPQGSLHSLLTLLHILP